jgi:sugar phosphate isomerase/epimerase
VTPEMGVFARVWRANQPRAIAEPIRALGLRHVQWNFSAIGRPTISSEYCEADFTEVKTAFAEAGVMLWGLSVTYNIIDRDQERCEAHTRAAEHMIRLAPLLGVEAVTICTGSNDPTNMWKFHPDNARADSWVRALEVIRRLEAAARESGVLVGVEPERANVVADASAAHRLLEALGERASVGVVLDPANLITVESANRQKEVLTQAFASLGDRVICLHAKDVVSDGAYSAAGQGVLDYDLIASLHSTYTPAAPVVIQDAYPDDMPNVIAYLRRVWRAVGIPKGVS